jgi:uncharacterized protein (DUF1778 family)
MNTPGNKKRSEKRKRNYRLNIRLTEEEQKVIRSNAAACSLDAPEFLRRLGQHHQVNSTLDHQAILKLLSLAANQGRLGGLLKLWLSRDPKYYTESISMVGSSNVRALLKKIEELQLEIDRLLRRL